VGTEFTDAFFAVWGEGQLDGYDLYLCDVMCLNFVAVGQDGEDTIVRARLPRGKEEISRPARSFWPPTTPGCLRRGRALRGR